LLGHLRFADCQTTVHVQHREQILVMRHAYQDFHVTKSCLPLCCCL